jgi:transposase InsO family protein
VDRATEVALFKYQVIAPLLGPAAPGETQRARIAALAERIHTHPVRGAIRLGYGTIEEWYYFYRREGLAGLRPKSRKDRGKSRCIDEVLAEEILAMVRERPQLDGPGILAEITARSGRDKTELPSLSTLYRFLKAEGLADRRRPPRADHRAFAFELAGDCWQADVMYGPSLPTRRGGRRRTYLLGVLDDATRLIPHAQFYVEQHLRSLKDCLKQAFLKRGLPRRLYVDNGKIFRSRSLLLLAARLGIQILHTKPYRPQGRAKLERWFGSVKRRFLSRVDLDRLGSLDQLNRLLFAFVEGDYHVTPHRGIDGETPLDRWVRLSEGIRPVPTDIDLDEVFLEEARRRIARDGTLRLRGHVFEAGPLHIGRRKTVLFDPYDLRRVWLRDDDRLIEIFPVDLTANLHVRRTPGPEPSKTDALDGPLVFFDHLAENIEERDSAEDTEPEDGDEPC